MRMSGLKRLQQAETDALERLKKAAEGIAGDLDREGLTGERYFRERNERLRPLQKVYEQKRWERTVGERDVYMLHRGTWRGFLLASGIVVLLGSVATFVDALTFEPGEHVPIAKIAERDPVPEGFLEMWAEFRRDRYLHLAGRSATASRRWLFGEACFGLIFSAGCFYATWRLSRIPE